VLAAVINAANSSGARSSQARATLRIASNAANPAPSNSGTVALLAIRVAISLISSTERSPAWLPDRFGRGAKADGHGDAGHALVGEPMTPAT
jgi:hypothetical protein